MKKPGRKKSQYVREDSMEFCAVVIAVDNVTLHIKSVVSVPLLNHNMASIAPSRLAALVKTRCTVFQTSYNPTSVRTGAKYLRARLRGPSMLNYYPPTLSLASIIREFPKMELVDTAEQQRLQDIEDRKKRGKGAPKKAKSKGLSSRSRFSPILLLNFSSVVFAFQLTADVRRGNGREKDEGIFCGTLLEDLLSNLECINSTPCRSTLSSISAWSQCNRSP